eukprot:m.444190 g.444190  ORF g.444190 m.444190 type:complete len:446 (+) comp20296_c9_seq1:161-1498(+)
MTTAVLESAVMATAVLSTPEHAHHRLLRDHHTPQHVGLAPAATTSHPRTMQNCEVGGPGQAQGQEQQQQQQQPAAPAPHSPLHPPPPPLQLFTPRKIYWSVHNQEGMLPQLLFPDRNRKDMQCFVAGKTPATKDDLWIVRNFFGCPKQSRLSSFPGRVLVFNAESHHTQLPVEALKSGRVWYAGAYYRPTFQPDVLPHTSVMLAALYASAVLDPALRMGVGFDVLSASHFENNGEYFLAYTTSNCKKFRDAAFDAIYRARQGAGLSLPTALGRCNGGHRDAANRTTGPAQRLQNFVMFRSYRFVLCMENAVHSGYVTEKIMHAFAAGAVPVWFGTTDALEAFNKHALIFWDPSNPQPALDEIMALDRDPEAYQRKRRQPMFVNGTQTVADYFSLAERHAGGRMRSLLLSAMNTVPRTWPAETPTEKADRLRQQSKLEYERTHTWV